MDNFDYMSYVLHYDVLYNTDNIFVNGAFKSDDGRSVPIVPMAEGHNCWDQSICLGQATLEHRDDGMVAKCIFAEHDAGRLTKDLVVNTKEMGLSIYAHGVRWDASAIPIHKVLSGRISAVIVVPMDRMHRPVED